MWAPERSPRGGRRRGASGQEQGAAAVSRPAVRLSSHPGRPLPQLRAGKDGRTGQDGRTGWISKESYPLGFPEATMKAPGGMGGVGAHTWAPALRQTRGPAARGLPAALPRCSRDL